MEGHAGESTAVVLKAIVAYDGSGFHGFAANEGVRTVAGVLEDALARVYRVPVSITCAGRTDKGVHGRGQVISFEPPSSATVDVERLHHSLNRLCGPEIVVRDLVEADPGFDARFSAIWRRYRYHVWTARFHDPSRRLTTWHVPHELDVDAMVSGASSLIGEHDFSSFCRRPKSSPGQPEPSLVRRVIEASWQRGESNDVDLLTFEIRATSFCHQMVRSIVGTLVDIGSGRIEPEAVPDILDARDRLAAGRVAPAQGLTLWDVGY